jgi:hypothetical protein
MSRNLSFLKKLKIKKYTAVHAPFSVTSVEAMESMKEAVS